jgi:hypothetical protein
MKKDEENRGKSTEMGCMVWVRGLFCKDEAIWLYKVQDKNRIALDLSSRAWPRDLFPVSS